MCINLRTLELKRADGMGGGGIVGTAYRKPRTRARRDELDNMPGETNGQWTRRTNEGLDKQHAQMQAEGEPRLRRGESSPSYLGRVDAFRRTGAGRNLFRRIRRHGWANYGGAAHVR